MKLKKFFAACAVSATFFILFAGCEKDAVPSDQKSKAKAPVEQKTIQPIQSEGTPRVSVLEESYEFSPVVDGEKVTHDFFIVNRGGGDLMINRVKTS